MTLKKILISGSLITFLALMAMWSYSEIQERGKGVYSDFKDAIIKQNKEKILSFNEGKNLYCDTSTMFSKGEQIVVNNKGWTIKDNKFVNKDKFIFISRCEIK